MSKRSKVHLNDGGFPACGVFISPERDIWNQFTLDTNKVNCINCKKGSLFKEKVKENNGNT